MSYPVFALLLWLTMFATCLALVWNEDRKANPNRRALRRAARQGRPIDWEVTSR